MNHFVFISKDSSYCRVKRVMDGEIFCIGEEVKIPSSTLWNKPSKWIIKDFHVFGDFGNYTVEYRVTFKASDNENDISTVDYLINDIEKYYPITMFL